MSDQEFHQDLNEFPATPGSRRWWPNFSVILAFLGSIYGAAVGSTISTSAGAADVIAAAAGIVAVLCGVPGARFGLFLGLLSLQNDMRSENTLLNRVRHGRLFAGTVAAIGGAILGGYLGLMAVTPLGVVFLGVVGGWLFMQAVLRRFYLRRFLGGVAGAVLGVCVGAIVMAVRRDQSAALAGLAWGGGIGAIVGLLLFLLFIRTLRSLLPKRSSEGGNYIDATFQREDQGGRPAREP